MKTDEPRVAMWDFSTPVTPIDLGSKVAPFAELDGPTQLTVVFPSGRTVEGLWQRGALAEAIRGSMEAPEPVDTVVFQGPSTGDVDVLRAEADRFVAEWGPAVDFDGGDLGVFIDQVAARLEAEGGELGDLYDVGDNVKSFHAPEQDGISPVVILRFTGDRVTVRWQTRFEPAPG